MASCSNDTTAISLQSRNNTLVNRMFAIIEEAATMSLHLDSCLLCSFRKLLRHQLVGKVRVRGAHVDEDGGGATVAQRHQLCGVILLPGPHIITQVTGQSWTAAGGHIAL